MSVDRKDFVYRIRKCGRKEKVYRHKCDKCGNDRGYICLSKIDGIYSYNRPCKECRTVSVAAQNKGRPPPNKGIPMSEATRQKLRQYTGRSPANKGSKVPEERKKKISCKVRGLSLEEFDDFGWKKTPVRKREFNIELRQRCFELANYTCDCCSLRGGVLNAHHLYDYVNHPNLLNEITNLVCLCKECHVSFHVKYGRTKRSKNIVNTKEQYLEFKECYHGSK